MAQGKGFLKVCGILMIIGGAIGTIFSGFVGMVGAAAVSLNEAVGGSAVTGVSSGGIIFACVLAIIAGVLELICGIIGVVNCDKPEKANTCFTWGLIVGVVAIISFIVGAINSGFSIVSLITSLVLPVLFCFGALKNKQSVAG